MALIKILSFACSALLLLAIIPMPAGYYTLLRLVVTVCSIAIVAKGLNNLLPVWIVLFVFTALLFNPILPIYFHKKSIWLPVDVVSAIIFAVYGLKHKYPEKM